MTSRQRIGMTLLEVTVALAIAAVALLAGGSALGFLTDQQSREGIQRIASASQVRAQLREWISDATLATEGDAEFRGASADNGMFAPRDGDDVLAFVTRAPTEVSAAGTRIRIYVERSDTASVRGLVAELTPWRRPGNPEYVSLAPAATAFRTRYLAGVEPARWDEEWATTSVLPVATELRIEFAPPSPPATEERAARALLALPIRIPLRARQ